MRTGTLITSSAWSTVIFLNSVAASSFGIQLVPRELHWDPLLPVFFLALTVSTTLVWWSYLKLDTAWPLYHLNPHPFACSTLVGLPPKCHLITHRVNYPFYKCIGHCQSSSFGMDTYSVIVCIIILIISIYAKCSAQCLLTVWLNGLPLLSCHGSCLCCISIATLDLPYCRSGHFQDIQDILFLQCCATIIVLDSEEGRPVLLYLSLHLLVFSMLFHDQLVSFRRSTLQCCKCAACKTSVVGFSFFLLFLEGLPPPPSSQINTWGLILPYACLVLAWLDSQLF